MGGIQHPHWHIASVHLASLCRSPQCHYLQRQCHHSAPYFSFMYEEDCAITQSVGGKEEILNNLCLALV